MALGSGQGEMALEAFEKKRHLAPFSCPVLTILSGFFCELFPQGANGRDCGSEKDGF
jgi:hypothetical protein